MPASDGISTRQGDGTWREDADTSTAVAAGAASSASGPSGSAWPLRIEQALNQPPEVVAVGPAAQTVRLTNLNPQFLRHDVGNDPAVFVEGREGQGLGWRLDDTEQLHSRRPARARNPDVWFLAHAVLPRWIEYLRRLHQRLRGTSVSARGCARAGVSVDCHHQPDQRRPRPPTVASGTACVVRSRPSWPRDSSTATGSASWAGARPASAY